MRMVRFTRVNKAGDDRRQAAVSPALVRHVFERRKRGGTYIAFEDRLSTDGPDAVLFGTPVAECFDTVVKRLNRAYYCDLALRLGGFLIAAAGAVFVIWNGS